MFVMRRIDDVRLENVVLRRSTIVYCDSYENDNLFCNKCAFVRLRAALFVRLPSTNDRIATQRYSSPEIPIGSRVMSRTTSEPSDGRSRKMVANVAGCRSFLYISRLSYQHCIHACRTATKFGTHIRMDVGLIRT